MSPEVFVRRHQRRRVRKKESLTSRGQPSGAIEDVEGMTGPVKVTLSDGDRQRTAIVKSAAEGGMYSTGIAESVADTIDDLLEWDIVPPTSARIEPSMTEPLGTEIVTIQEWIDGVNLQGRDDFNFPSHAKRVMQIAIFDFIIGNRDRHEGNLMKDNNGKLWAIDNANSFRDGIDHALYKDFLAYNKVALYTVSGKEIPDKLLNDLKNVEEGDLRAAVAPLGANAVEGAVFRWKALVKNGRMPEMDYGHGYGVINWKEYTKGIPHPIRKAPRVRGLELE